MRKGWITLSIILGILLILLVVGLIGFGLKQVRFKPKTAKEKSGQELGEERKASQEELDVEEKPKSSRGKERRKESQKSQKFQKDKGFKFDVEME